jgi:hypothetical protein
LASYVWAFPFLNKSLDLIARERAGLLVQAVSHSVENALSVLFESCVVQIQDLRDVSVESRVARFHLAISQIADLEPIQVSRFGWIKGNVTISFARVTMLIVGRISFITKATSQQVLKVKLFVWMPSLAMPMFHFHGR